MQADRRLGDPVRPMVVERFYDRDLTGRGRALKLLRRVLLGALGTLGLALLLVPLEVVALVTLDLPLRLFDRWGPAGNLAVSSWLNRGDGMMALVLFIALGMARRWGSGQLSRVILTSWFISLTFLAMVIVDLAPELQAGDFPRARLLAGWILSWAFGQLVAVAIYDLTRGGVWWRAPFFGSLFGLLVRSLVFFPASHGGTGTPWGFWMAESFILSAVVAAAFTLAYVPVRAFVRPRHGLGGR